MSDPTPDALPKLKENPELDEKLFWIAVNSYANGGASAFSRMGASDVVAMTAGRIWAHQISEDPIARMAVITDARLAFEGRHDERRPIRLDAARCEHGHDSHNHGSHGHEDHDHQDGGQ